MTITRQDLLDVLGDNPCAEEILFLHCYCWHRGKGSDLYRILRESKFEPDIRRKFADDPLVISGLEKLEQAFGPMIETRYMPILIADVEEGDVLVSGETFICLPNKWPCRVHTHAGAFGVRCSGGFHPLEADHIGFVKGFRR